ncbi:MAG: cytochrome-c peroxidase [Nitrospiraceae bacterium]
MIVQMVRNTNAIVLALAGFLLFVSPQSSLSEEAGQPQPLGQLPNVRIPSQNLQFDAKVALGKLLFFDSRLSKDGSVSCASCHVPAAGFSDPRQFSLGVGGKQGGRNAPPALNAAYNHLQFWDGRAGSLEEQALGPIQNPIEMSETLEGIVKKLSKNKVYQFRFRAVFGGDVSPDNIAKAIAAFERTLISTNSPFDQFIGGDKSALSEAAQRGLELFQGKARCVLCHNGPNFTDNKFHNIGVPQTGPLKEDVGRYAVTKRESDRGAFKTPSLRSIALTAPYMHTGGFKTLEEVMEFYNKGGELVTGKDAFMTALNLTDQEKKDLVEFMNSLTGELKNMSLPKLP